MSSQKQIRLGVVGLSASGESWFERSHFHYIQGRGASLYSISALSNRSKESAQKAKEKFQLPPNTATYGDAESIANDSNVDVIVVSVKVPEHYQYVKAAIDAGKDIFVEWPLARNLAEAEELTDLAEKKGVKTFVGLQARQAGSIRKAKEMIDRGDLGKILGSTMLGNGNILGAVTQEPSRYLQFIENGANLVTIPFGHAIDALCQVLGELEFVSAVLEVRRGVTRVVDLSGNLVTEAEPYTSHDYAAVTGNLVSGGVVNVVYQGGSSRTDKNFWWEINGTKGTLLLEAPVGHPQMWPPTLKFIGTEEGATLEEIQVDGPNGVDFSYGVGLAWDTFAGQNDRQWITFRDALLRHRMIDAVYRSNKSGKRETYL